ncbi:Ommochrome-binding protein [Eumeta japonica]|uniref:Ommochrome-binding protein n=1 Tax=Eumeta variegata TaxID=151549 RepID=A0A4C1X916_EUMVA|nr:Ommochrome-binding protein [Eumeta japonica]
MADSECDGVVVRGRCHEKEVLVDNLNWPFHPVMDYHTNLLYFTNTLIDGYVSCYLDLDTKELDNITQVANGFAQAVDQEGHQVYVGGTDGIYKYFHDNKTVERVADNEGYIMSMVYKDALYYTVYPQFVVYTLKNGESAEAQQMDHDKEILAIDKDNYQFFRNSSGLYGRTKESSDSDVYSKEIHLTAMTTDANGLPYLCGVDGFFFVNKHRKSLEKISDLNSCRGLVFDKDNNMIYFDLQQMIRLKLKVENNLESNNEENSD